MARPEDRLRSRCRMYLNAALPSEAFWSAIEHGQKFSGDAEQRARQWNRLHAQGVKTGLADIFIWWKRQFIAVELKVGTNDTSVGQDNFADGMWRNGFNYLVIRSVEALHHALCAHGMPIARSMLTAAQHHDLALTVPDKAKGRCPAPRAMRERPTGAQVRKVAAIRQKVMF